MDFDQRTSLLFRLFLCYKSGFMLYRKGFRTGTFIRHWRKFYVKWTVLIDTEGYFIEFNIIDININLSKIGRNGKLEITMKFCIQENRNIPGLENNS